MMFTTGLWGDIRYESGSLREFIGGNSPGTAYENYISHVVEGIIDTGYNDYGPDWLDVQTNGFGHYRQIPVNSPTLTYWSNIFTHVLTGDTTAADQLLTDSLTSFNYELVLFSDTTNNRDYLMVREGLDYSYNDENLPEIPEDNVAGSFRNGWGLYIYCPTASRPQLMYEVPHPCDDFIAPYLAVEAFLQTDARALCIAGAGREVAWTGEGNYNNNKSLSDPSRNANTVFQQFHILLAEALAVENMHSPVIFQFHSFDNEAHEGLNSVILSAGSGYNVANKPIRDLSVDHRDIVNFTNEITIMPGTYGSHGMVRVDQYYEVNYDGEFFYSGEYGTYFIKKATGLTGAGGNVQINHTHGLYPDRDVFERFIHVEFDEKPELFEDLGWSLDTLYAGDYPTSYHNFSTLLSYYQPFLMAINDYFIDWENLVDQESPAGIDLFYPASITPGQITFRWQPSDDTNFLTYRIFYGVDSVTLSSPFFARDDFPLLMDMRQNVITVPRYLFPDTAQVAIGAIDYFGNLSPLSPAVPNFFPGHSPPVSIITFDSTLVLDSYPGEDMDTQDWAVVSIDDYSGLQLSGNTWKTAAVTPAVLDSESVWTITVRVDSVGEIQGFGLMDSLHFLPYSLFGSEQVDADVWKTAYQGYYPIGQWLTIPLPVGRDWLALFDYLPDINRLAFINDADTSPPGTIIFSQVMDLTPDQNIPPQITLHYTIGRQRMIGNNRTVSVSFWVDITDPDSFVFDYHWDFGDGTDSNEANPEHTFTITDDHAYRVLATVTDQQGAVARSAVTIAVDAGNSSLPLAINFVGDIMLARGLEEEGGIIPTYGVSALFGPTQELLGNAADISVANLECALTREGDPHPTKPIIFKGNPENASGLAFAGIDVVSLANNHSLDYGLIGLHDTQSALDDYGILYSGAGENAPQASEPLIVIEKGLAVAFLAFSDRTGQYNNYQPYLQAGWDKPGFAYMTPYNIRTGIAKIRNVVDLVVMEFHAGSEYSTGPGSGYDSFDPGGDFGNRRESRTTRFGVVDPLAADEDYTYRIDVPHMWDREIRQFAIDEGADLVIVHHPHKIQGIEVYQGKVIAHSLGNFIFDLDYPETMPSVIFEAQATTDGFADFWVYPVFLDHYIPRPAQGDLALYILDDLAMKSRNLQSYLQVNRLARTANIILNPEDTFPYRNPNRRFASFVNDTSLSILLHQTGSIARLGQINPPADWSMRLGREKIWMGNFEDEGANLWNLNSSDEMIDPEAGVDGRAALFQRRNANAGDNIVTNFQQRFLLAPDRPATLSAWIKTENAAQVSVEIRFYANRYTTDILAQSDLGVWLNGDHDWQKYETNISIPETAEFFDIRCNSGIPPFGEALSWFDNVSLIQWEPWFPWTEGETILWPNDYYAMQLTSGNAPDSAIVEFEENYLAVPPPLIPEFMARERSGAAPLDIHFVNLSEGLDGWWEWDFGDETISVLENPVHRYSQPGIYAVTLRLKDHAGIFHSRTKEQYIIVSSSNPPLVGDVNLDGEIDMVDLVLATYIVMQMVTPVADQFLAGDLNYDYEIDIHDVLLLADMLWTRQEANREENNVPPYKISSIKANKQYERHEEPYGPTNVDGNGQ